MKFSESLKKNRDFQAVYLSLIHIYLTQTFVALDFIILVPSHFLQDGRQFFLTVRIPDSFVLLQLEQRRLCQIQMCIRDRQ